MTRGKRIACFAALALAAPLLLLALVLASIDRQVFSDYAAQEIAAAAAREKILLSFGESRLFMPGLRGKDIAVTLPLQRIFLLLNIPSAELRVSPGALLARRLQGTLSGQAYSGSFSADFTAPFSGGETRFSLMLRDLSLPAHPQLSGLGIRSGSLSVEATDIEIAGGAPTGGKLAVRIAALNKPGVNVIPASFSGQEIPLQIPAITDLNLNARLTLAKERVQLDELSAASSLGRLSAEGRLEHSRQQPGTLDASVRVELSAAGAALFQPALAAAALHMLGYGVSSDLKPDTRSFSIEIKGLLPKPALRFETTKRHAQPDLSPLKQGSELPQSSAAP